MIIAETIDAALPLMIVADGLFAVKHPIPETMTVCETRLVPGKVVICEHGYQFVRQGERDTILSRNEGA